VEVMIWRAYWWGIEIIAESPQDGDMLKSLADKLPKEVDPWDHGELRTSDKSCDDFNDAIEGFTLTFSR
jgi:hypothetical protein